MKATTVLLLIGLGASLLFLSGCGEDNAMMSRETPLVARTVPAEGELAFDPAALIHIKFSSSIDTSHFHQKFFIVDATMHDPMHDSLGGGTMNDSMIAICDSMSRGMMGRDIGDMMGGRHGDMDGSMPGQGMMNSMMNMMDDDHHMADTAAFYRRMHDQGMSGQFEWNATRDSCAFRPDSPLMGNRDYVIMMRNMGSRMHDGVMDNEMSDLMIRFHTR